MEAGGDETQRAEVALTPLQFLELVQSDPHAIDTARSVWPAPGERGPGVIWVRYATQTGGNPTQGRH